MLPTYPLPTSSLVIAPRLRPLAERPRLLRRCALFATGGEPNEVAPTSGAMRTSIRPGCGPEWPQTEHRIEARNTTRAEPSPSRPTGKIIHLPYCPRHRPLSDG